MASGAPELPKTYKAAIYDKVGELSTKVVEKDMPEPGPGECLINLTYSGVCHSDFAMMTNGWAGYPDTPKDQVGGHEGVGRVVKLGPGAEAHVKLGDVVGIKWLAKVCFSCPPCLEMADGICLNQKVSGHSVPGTFQQYVLSPAAYVTPIPHGIDDAAVAPLLCGGITVYSALRKSGALAGEWIVVSGAGGGLGHLCVQIASRGMGLRVIGVDHSSKESLALSSGAEVFIGYDKVPDTVAAVMSATENMGAKAVIVCTAANSAYAQAMGMLRFRGTLVCVGIPEGPPVDIQGAVPGWLIAKETKIVGSAVGDRREAMECLALAARGVVKVHYTTVGLEDLTQVFQDMHAGKLQGRCVVDLSR